MPNQVLEGQLPAPLGFTASGTPTANGLSFDNPGRFPPAASAPLGAPAGASFDNPPAQPAPPSAPGTMERPGTYESYWASVAPQFQQPGFTEQAYGNTVGGYQGLMQQQGPTFAADAYQSFGGGVPANLDPYFDRAWTTGSQRLNDAFGARGQFNSSEATRQLSDLAGNLGAQQAREEGQYNLDRARTGGALASSASGEQMGNLGRQESLLGSVFDTAQETDEAKLRRLVGGMGGAQTAQQMTEGRTQQGLDNLFRFSGAVGDTFSQGSLAAIAADMEAQGVPHELAMAFAKMKMDDAAQQGAAARDTVGTVTNLISAF